MSDRELIEKLGGATIVAKQLGYVPQRVQNWTVRGIPAREKLKHPELFLAAKVVETQKEIHVQVVAS
jgi:hypothetical protein